MRLGFGDRLLTVLYFTGTQRAFAVFGIKALNRDG